MQAPPAAPATDATPPAVVPEANASDVGQTQDPNAGWFGRSVLRFFGGAPDPGQTQTGDSAASTPDAGADGSTTGGNVAVAESPAPDAAKVFATEAEYREQVRREAQSMRDKERAREDASRKAADDTAERARLDSLYETDPLGYADAVRSKEQADAARTARAREQVESLEMHREMYDRTIVDPVILKLPEAVRVELLQAAGPIETIEGRGALVTSAIERLQQSAAATAREEGRREALANAHKDPSVRQLVLSEVRGGRPEPELAPGASTEADGAREGDMNHLLRVAAHRAGSLYMGPRQPAQPQQ